MTHTARDLRTENLPRSHFTALRHRPRLAVKQELSRKANTQRAEDSGRLQNLGRRPRAADMAPPGPNVGLGVFVFRSANDRRFVFGRRKGSLGNGMASPSPAFKAFAARTLSVDGR